jgi:ubiquinone/menaquinone biosynthesis C-methylase UbiE
MDAWGLDISFRLLSEGKTSDAELPLLCASGEHLPFGCGSLDGIICECVLSLLPEPGRALSEFYRVLRREGCLILSDIYLRGGETGEWVPAEEENLRKKPVYGCLKGALPTYSTETMLSQAGFAIHLWEDHTPFIKEFAARLVLAHGSLDAFFGGEKDAGCSGMGLPTMGALSPGYYLLVARKK